MTASPGTLSSGFLYFFHSEAVDTNSYMPRVAVTVKQLFFFLKLSSDSISQALTNQMLQPANLRWVLEGDDDERVISLVKLLKGI